MHGIKNRRTKVMVNNTVEGGASDQGKQSKLSYCWENGKIIINFRLCMLNVHTPTARVTTK